jgi:hypothetical protein
MIEILGGSAGQELRQEGPVNRDDEMRRELERELDRMLLQDLPQLRRTVS